MVNFVVLIVEGFLKHCNLNRHDLTLMM